MLRVLRVLLVLCLVGAPTMVMCCTNTTDTGRWPAGGSWNVELDLPDFRDVNGTWYRGEWLDGEPPSSSRLTKPLTGKFAIDLPGGRRTGVVQIAPEVLCMGSQFSMNTYMFCTAELTLKADAAAGHKSWRAHLPLAPSSDLTDCWSTWYAVYTEEEDSEPLLQGQWSAGWNGKASWCRH